VPCPALSYPCLALALSFRNNNSSNKKQQNNNLKYSPWNVVSPTCSIGDLAKKNYSLSSPLLQGIQMFVFVHSLKEEHATQGKCLASCCVLCSANEVIVTSLVISCRRGLVWVASVLSISLSRLSRFFFELQPLSLFFCLRRLAGCTVQGFSRNAQTMILSK